MGKPACLGGRKGEYWESLVGTAAPGTRMIYMERTRFWAISSLGLNEDAVSAGILHVFTLRP